MEELSLQESSPPTVPAGEASEDVQGETVLPARVSRRDAFLQSVAKVEAPADARVDNPTTAAGEPAVAAASAGSHKQEWGTIPKPLRGHQLPAGFSIYVGNMPMTFGEEDMANLVRPYNAFDMRFYAREKKRFGFAVFKNLEDAQRCIAELGGRYIDERRLFVNMVREKSRVRILEGNSRNGGSGDGFRGRGRGGPNFRGRAGFRGSRGRAGLMASGSYQNGPQMGVRNVPMATLQGATDLVFRIDALLEEVLDECFFCGRIKSLVGELQHVMNDIQNQAYAANQPQQFYPLPQHFQTQQNPRQYQMHGGPGAHRGRGQVYSRRRSRSAGRMGYND